MNGLDMLGALESPAAITIIDGEDDFILGEGWVDMLPTFGAAAGEAIKRGVEYKQGKDATEKASSEEKARLQAALDADAAATSAVSLALLSAEVARGAPAAQKETAEAKAAADKAAADLKIRAQDDASYGLSAESQKVRRKAALEAVEKATAALQKAPTDSAAKARLRAAQATEVRASNAQLAALAPSDRAAAEMVIQRERDQAASGGGIGAWLTEEWHGIPKWSWGLGGAGALGIAWWLIRGRR